MSSSEYNFLLLESLLIIVMLAIWLPHISLAGQEAQNIKSELATQEGGVKGLTFTFQQL